MNDTHPSVDPAVREAIARHAERPGALLPILHDVQDALGCVPPAAVPGIAAALNLSRAEVHGVLTYYHDFRDTPAAPHRLRVCRAEACQAMGAEALLEHARRHLDCDAQGRSANGAVDVDAAYCLGLCACSPAVALNGELHARVTREGLDALLKALPASKGVT